MKLSILDIIIISINITYTFLQEIISLNIIIQNKRRINMRRISLFIIINAISLYIISNLMSSVYISSLGSLLMLTVIFGCLNLIVKPIIQFFSLPITFLTLGLFSLVINGIVLYLAFTIVPGVHLNGFLNSIWAAILLSIANSIFYNIFD